MSKVMEVLLRHGKITQERYDGEVAKEEIKRAVKEDYSKNKGKMTNAQLKETIEKLIE